MAENRDSVPWEPGNARNEDRCASCGRTIPEGRQVCPVCEKGVGDDDQRMVADPNLLIRILRWLHVWSVRWR